MTPDWKGDTARRGAPLPLTFVASAVAVAFAAPIVFVVWRVATLDGDLGEVLSESLAPAWRTVQLAAIVGAATGVIGTGLAWLLVRTDVPLASLWRLLAPLPLVFPSFIGAGAFLAGLGPDGLLREALELAGYHAPRRFRGLGASAFVLTAFTYPYVYLPVAARLAAVPAHIEESCRLLGDRPWRSFARVTIPMVRGSIAGGVLIVVLYSFSEFGAVQLLGFDTLTRVVYSTRLADRAVSFTAATLLIVMALGVIVIERRLRGSLDHRATVATRRQRPIPLGWWRLPALASVVLVITVALVVPTVSLGRWAWWAIARREDRWAALGDELSRLRSPAWTTSWLAVVTSVIALTVVLPIGVLSVRYRSRVAGALNGAVLAGFAVPGIVIALSVAFWALNVPGFVRWYQTAPLLLAAYVVHFGSQALRSTETSAASVPRRLDESARLLGASAIRRAVTVHLPLMAPGLIAGAGLVMLSTLKELPATLLLAPIGYRTLATLSWGSFNDGLLGQAGFSSLALLSASALLTWLFVLRRVGHVG